MLDVMWVRCGCGVGDVLDVMWVRCGYGMYDVCRYDIGTVWCESMM